MRKQFPNSAQDIKDPSVSEKKEKYSKTIISRDWCCLKKQPHTTCFPIKSIRISFWCKQEHAGAIQRATSGWYVLLVCKGEEEHVPNQVLLPEVHPLLSQGRAANRGAIWRLVFPAADSVQTLLKKEHLSVAVCKLLQPRCLSIGFYKIVLLQVTVDTFPDSSFWHLCWGHAVITFL